MNRQQSIAVALQSLMKDARQSASQAVVDNLSQAISALRKQYEVGIITALPIETTAVNTVMGPPARVPSQLRDAVSFFELTIDAKAKSRLPAVPTKQRSKTIVVAECMKMGNNSAAVAAAAMLSAYPTIKSILLVGIAGGIPHIPRRAHRSNVDDHVRKGDIVIGDQVIQYDMIKLEVDGYENRSKSQGPSARLMRAVSQLQQQTLNGNYPWERTLDLSLAKLKWARPRKDLLYDFCLSETGVKQLKQRMKHPIQRQRRKSRPMIHRANIGSANILLKNPAIRDQLRTIHKIRAVEMEGSGVADAAWAFDVGYLVIRGVCDYCDMNKDDSWQQYAALAAASYARSVVQEVLFE